MFTRPVTGTKPLFSIQNTDTGERITTIDPYYFVEKEKLDWQLLPDHPHHDYYADAVGYSMDQNHSDWQSLIGFAYEARSATGQWRRLSNLLDSAHFPVANQYRGDVWVRVQSGTND